MTALWLNCWFIFFFNAGVLIHAKHFFTRGRPLESMLSYAKLEVIIS